MHQTRYAHCEGYTDICFTEKDKFLTTGEDGDIRIWDGFDDLDNASIRVGDKCFAIAYKNGKIYVADELNEVKRYDLETNEFQGVITSFTLPVTTICVNKSDTFIACGSSDFDIHLVDLKTLKFTAFPGHDAPILFICFDPLEKYFVSSSCDGTARFWSTQTLNTVKTLVNLHPKSNDFNDSLTLCKIAWHKDGGLIAVPSAKEIQFYERESWYSKFKIELQSNTPNEDFLASIVCFSPDGKHVLATTNTQMIYIHSIINKSMVFKYSYTKKAKICSLSWNPTNQSEIIFCDVNGYMGLVKPSLKDAFNEEPEPEKTTSKKKSNKIDDDENLEMDDLLGLIDTDNEKSNDSKPSNKTSRDAMKSPNKKRKRLSEDKMETNSKDENADEDDDDMVSLEKLKENTYNSVKKEILMLDEENNDEIKLSKEEYNQRNEIKNKETLKQLLASNMQQAFQASSTPLSLLERYMTWNSTGVITQFLKEGDESIDIEFHNASYHHTIHVKNIHGYTMADMSKEAIVLASPGKIINDEEECSSTILSTVSSQSKLACILINSCDNHKEWSVELPRKEYIRCVCASRCLVACLTSKRFLRIYGLAGTQKEIICLNGVPLCMCSYENAVFVCYYSSLNSVINYSIYYLLDDCLKKQREAEHGILPLSENAKLEWIGFSDEGNPYCCDSNGYLFTKTKANVWMPLSDLRFGLNHKSDNYWMIGVSERNQVIKAILCKGAKYPQVLPRPTLTTLSFNLPFCETDTEKTHLEKDLWKNKYLARAIQTYDCSSALLDIDQEEMEEKVEKFESNARELLMKLFMYACKNGREQRAFEIASIMEPIALQLAIKYATKTRALVLAQNLNMLCERKTELEYERERQSRMEQDNNNAFIYRQQRHSNEDVEEIKSTSNKNDEVIFESETTTQKTQSENESSMIKCTASSTSTFNDSLKSYATPTSIPLTTTRLNPFKAISNSANKTPLNDASKSIINELEEKVNKQSANKEKDAWKPTPTRSKVLSKNKVSTTPTSSINSFFSSSTTQK